MTGSNGYQPEPARRVVITGLGAVTPLGVGARRSFTAWANGKVGVEDGRGACSDFAGRDHLTVKEARRLDRFCQFAAVAADEALAEAEWDDGLPTAPGRIACLVGTGVGGLGTFLEQYRIYQERGPEMLSPLTIPAAMGNAAAAILAMRYGLRGHSYCVMSACASGANAIGSAMRLIQNGDADAALAGGTEAALGPFGIAAFSAMGAISPSGVPRPFDAHRDGTVLGEGAAVLVLEEAEAAAARGAPVLGEMLGYGVTSDAHHVTAPDPEGRWAVEAIRLAMQERAVRPEHVAYVNAHGTATDLNDRTETIALKRALGRRAYEIPISSTKSTTGHTLGAAGAIEAVFSVLSLRQGIAPPTLNLDEPEVGLDLDFVPGEAKPIVRPPERFDGTQAVVLSNSFGFGGHNVVLSIGCRDAALN